MSYFKKLTFLKVLTTVAWADGEVTQSELNILKSFYRKFDLDKNELAELRHYLAAPVSKKEQTELYDQLVRELSSEREKEESNLVNCPFCAEKIQKEAIVCYTHTHIEYKQ